MPEQGSEPEGGLELRGWVHIDEVVRARIDQIPVSGPVRGESLVCRKEKIQP